MIETEYVFQQDTQDHSQEPQKPGNQVKKMLITQLHILTMQKLQDNENQKLILNIMATFLKGILL